MNKHILQTVESLNLQTQKNDKTKRREQNHKTFYGSFTFFMASVGEETTLLAFVDIAFVLFHFIFFLLHHKRILELWTFKGMKRFKVSFTISPTHFLLFQFINIKNNISIHTCKNEKKKVGWNIKCWRAPSPWHEILIDWFLRLLYVLKRWFIAAWRRSKMQRSLNVFSFMR